MRLRTVLTALAVIAIGALHFVVNLVLHFAAGVSPPDSAWWTAATVVGLPLSLVPELAAGERMVSLLLGLQSLLWGLAATLLLRWLLGRARRA